MRDVLATALRAIALGYAIVFVRENDKRPCDQGWETKVVTAEEATVRFGNRPKLNVGLRLGPAENGGLVDFDFDGPTAEAEFQKLFAGCEVPRGPRWRSNRGWHLLFRFHPRLAAIGKATIKIGDLEIRLGCGKGAQTVIPPSVVDGQERESIDELSSDCLPPELPEIVVDRILAAHAAESKKPKPEPRSKPRTPRDDYNETGPPFGDLLPGWEDMGGDAYRRAGKTEGSSSAKVVKAKDGCPLLHVFSNNAAPLQEHKNYSRFALLALLKHGGDEAKAEAEIRALGYGTRIIFKALTCAELDGSDFRREYLVRDTLVAREPCILGGPKKALKTNTTIDLAESLATGTPFLGHLDVMRRCSVGIFSAESGFPTLQETARRVAVSKGLRLSAIDGLVWSDACPRFGNPEEMDGVDRFIKQYGIEALILDPVYMAMPGNDAGNLFITGELLRSVAEPCQRNGTTLILVHHAAKSVKQEFSPPQLGNIAWAGFQEFARQWLLLGRRQAYEPGTGEHKLWLSVGGSAGHSALYALDVNEGPSGENRIWAPRLSTPSSARAEAKSDSKADKLDAAKAKIIAALTKQANTQTGLEDIGIRHVKPALQALVAEGRVIETLIPKGNGQKYGGFALAT